MISDHPKVNYGKTGVLIINLGTPDSTSWLDIRKYLKEFLSDRRVIEVNPLIWQVILNLFILTFRPSKTAKAYKEIWMKDKNMSPLRFFTESQAHKLSEKIGNEKLIVDFAMRYGNPSIKIKINELHEKGCENLIILPLYPQYAAATTATVCDEVYRTLMKMRWQPNLKIIPHYESEPLYIDAIKNSIVKKINEINWKPDLIVASYHGIPKKYFDKGDPYHCYCHKTTRLIKEKFNKMLKDAEGKINVKEGIMGTDTVRAQQQALREKRKGLTEKSLDVAKAMKEDQDKIKIRLAKETETTIIPQIKKQLIQLIEIMIFCNFKNLFPICNISK